MRSKLLFLSLVFGLIPASAEAGSACTPPAETVEGLAIFEYVRARLNATPLTEKDSGSWVAGDSAAERGKWQAGFSDSADPANCYGFLAVQDYGSEANSLCRINEEITNPTQNTDWQLDLTKSSPYATAGYTYEEKSGSFKNIVSYLGRYQAGTLVYCGANKIEDFHKQAVALAEEAVADASAPKFTDTDSYAFDEAIRYIARKKIVSGYDDSTFRPDSEINRAEFTKIVVGAIYEENEIIGSSCFSDVGEEWFARFVCTAKENSIVGGYPDGTFGPGNPVTVAEGLKILVGALKADKVRTAKTDEQWYQPFIDYAKLNGAYLKNFTPGKKLTRGEMSELIYRLMNDTRSAEALDFLVTSPIVDSGTYETTELPVKIEGLAPAGSTITVNGSYKLSSCCADGGTSWSYNLKSEYGNIGAGTNNYTFTATDADGNKLGESKITVIYE